VTAKQVQQSWKSYSGEPATPATLEAIIRLSKFLHTALPASKRTTYQQRLEIEVAKAFHLTESDRKTLTEYYHFMRPPHEESSLFEEAEEEQDG